MSNFFHAFFYNPLLEALVWIYKHIAFQDFGLAVIVLTIAVQIILFPLFYKGAKQQALIQKIHPKIKEIQEKHKDNKERQATELMELYKRHGINPFASLLVIIVQLPIIIGLYQVILKEISNGLFDNFLFLGFIDVRNISIVLAIITAALQYVQVKMGLPKGKGGGSTGDMARIMLYVAPGITFLILTRVAAALGLYWVTTTLFSIGRHAYIMKTLKKEEEKEVVKEVEKELKEIHGTDSGKN